MSRAKAERDDARGGRPNSNRCQIQAEFKGRGQLIISLTQFATSHYHNLAKTKRRSLTCRKIKTQSLVEVVAQIVK